jgi:hypothetical protein
MRVGGAKKERGGTEEERMSTQRMQIALVGTILTIGGPVLA